GEVHRQCDVGHRLLGLPALVPHGDGIADVADPHLLYGHFAEIGARLHVLHRLFHPQSPRWIRSRRAYFGRNFPTRPDWKRTCTSKAPSVYHDLSTTPGPYSS